MAKEKTSSAINLPKDTKIEELKKKIAHEKKVALKYQKRRHNPWIEIYELYRNIVRVNRLTQRQAINIPLMKETIRAKGAKINEAPDVYLESRSGDMDKEIIINSLWEKTADDNSFELQDRADKKQELLYGRSHMMLNPTRNGIEIETKDIYEILIDPKTKPYDIETARYVVMTNMFRPLDEILADDKYDKDAKQELKEDFEGNKTTGTTSNSDIYKQQLKAKNERLQSVGVENVKDIEGYDKVANLDGHITHIWDKEIKKYVRYYIVMANDKVMLQADTLMDTIGMDEYPVEGWAEDMELADYWSDGTGDLIRVPNKTINSWISQYMENRTLRTFGMNFYNSKVKGFSPTTFQPKPFGWYPLPGKPDDVFKKVDVPEIQGTLNDIQYIVGIAEKASATGAIDKGAVEDQKRTLGEIEIAVGNALQVTNDMTLYYQTARQKLVEKWYKMMLGTIDDEEEITLYKKNAEGNLVETTVTKDQWADPKGYNVVVGNPSERLINKTNEVSRLLAVKAQFPNNAPLNKAIQKRMIGIVDLQPHELEEIEKFEAEQIEAQARGLEPVPENAKNANDTLKALSNRGGVETNPQAGGLTPGI